jgi:hypothetical protein
VFYFLILNLPFLYTYLSDDLVSSTVRVHLSYNSRNQFKLPRAWTVTWGSTNNTRHCIKCNRHGDMARVIWTSLSSCMKSWSTLHLISEVRNLRRSETQPLSRLLHARCIPFRAFTVHGAMYRKQPLRMSHLKSRDEKFSKHMTKSWAGDKLFLLPVISEMYAEHLASTADHMVLGNTRSWVRIPIQSACSSRL